MTTRQCPGVLGGCGGKGVVKGNEVLCPVCIKNGGLDKKITPPKPNR